jgi:tetratricopeptide (TPR) repeat protein
MNGDNETFQTVMSQGHSAAWEQDWELAASHYLKALDERPEDPQALTSLGLALVELRRYQDALTCYARAAKLVPQDPIPMERLAEIYEKLDQLEIAAKVSRRAAELYIKIRDANKATENLKRAANLNPEDVSVHSRLAMIYEWLGEKEQAIREYLAIASLLQSTGEKGQAIRTLEHAAKIAPESAEIRQALRLLREAKPLPRPKRSTETFVPHTDLEEAISEDLPPLIKERQALDPIEEANKLALGVLAGILFDQPDDGMSLSPGSGRGLHRLAGGNDSAQTEQEAHMAAIRHLSRAVDLQSQDNYALAAEELDRAIEAGINHPAAYFNLGFLRSEGNQLETALRMLQKALTHTEFSLASRLLKGKILRRLERLHEAATEYLEALKLADSCMLADSEAEDLQHLYDPLIESQARKKDLEAKTHICNSVSELLVRPDWRETVLKARQDLPIREEGEPPLPLGEILTEARSNQVIESIATVRRLVKARKLRSAMEEAYYALAFAPTYLPLHEYMGELLLEQRRNQEAIAKFTVIAKTYSSRGEGKQATDMLRKIIQMAPTDLIARERLIDQLVAGGSFEDAIGEYLQLGEFYTNQADMNRAREMYAEALKLVQQAKVDKEVVLQIQHKIGDIDLQRLNWRQAIKVYENIRNLEPGDKRARSELIGLNFRMGNETKALDELDDYLKFLFEHKADVDAIAFLESFLEENPDQPAVRQRLAEIYRSKGRAKEAIAQLNVAGQLFLKGGNRKSAIEAVETILALNPPNREEYKRLASRLQQA